MTLDKSAMQWLMRLTFVVWLIHFYVFDASLVAQRPAVFLGVAVIALTLMSCLGLVVSIARATTPAGLDSHLSQDQRSSFNFQLIAQTGFFSAILLISLFSADQTRQSLYQQIEKINQQTSLSLHPSILKKLSTVRSAKQGEFIARMIFRSHGVVLPYQIDQRNIFFTPNEQDKQASEKNRKHLIEAEKERNSLSQCYKTLCVLFYSQLAVIFISILATVFLIQAQKIK